MRSLKIVALAMVALALCFGQSPGASFFWKASLVDLQNVSTASSGDRGIVITDAGDVRFYRYTGSAWVEVDSITAESFVSSASDGEHYSDDSNSGTPSSTPTNEGARAYNRTSHRLSLYRTNWTTYWYPALSGTVAAAGLVVMTSEGNLEPMASRTQCSAGYAPLGIDTEGDASGCWQVTPSAIGAMTNPMTTQYDLIYGGSSGTPTRVATSAGFITAIQSALNGSGGLITYGNAAGAAAVLTGYTSGAGTVAATDTILQAIQKLNGNIAALTTWTGANSETITNADDTEIAFNGTESIALDLDAGTNKVEWKNKTTGSTSVDTMGFAALNLVTTGTIDGAIVVTESTDATVTVGGSTGWFTNADDDVIAFNLPAVPTGKAYCFSNLLYARAITINPDDADYIVHAGTTAAVGEAYVSSGARTDQVCVVGINASYWLVSSERGTWAEETP